MKKLNRFLLKLHYNRPQNYQKSKEFSPTHTENICEQKLLTLNRKNHDDRLTAAMLLKSILEEKKKLKCKRKRIAYIVSHGEDSRAAAVNSDDAVASNGDSSERQQLQAFRICPLFLLKLSSSASVRGRGLFLYSSCRSVLFGQNLPYFPFCCFSLIVSSIYAQPAARFLFFPAFLSFALGRNFSVFVLLPLLGNSAAPALSALKPFCFLLSLLAATLLGLFSVFFPFFPQILSPQLPLVLSSLCFFPLPAAWPLCF